MSCPRTRIQGSGYVKPADPAKAAEVEKAFQDAVAARTTYDSMWSQPVTYNLNGVTAAQAANTYEAFWTAPLEYDPNGSNAQPGWPSDDQSIAPLHATPESEWKDVTIDLAEYNKDIINFTGVADTSELGIEEIFDVSDCSGEPIKLDITKIKEDNNIIPLDDLIKIDDGDMIELVS